MSGIFLTLAGVSAASVPGAPTIGTATATGATTATVSFTAPASDGGSAITSYTATSSPGGVTGTLNQAGSGTITVTGLTTNTAYTFTVTATNAIGTSAASAASNSVTPTQFGKLFSFGNNFLGDLGLNDTNNRSSPVQIGGATNWKIASSGLGHCVAVKYDGTLWSWGRNGAGFSANGGQLGLGDVVRRSSPVQIGALTNWSDVFVGGYTSFAITTSGALYAWGYNAYGGLGLGDAASGFPRDGTARSSPVQLGGQTGWTSGHAMQTGGGAAIRAGKMYSWGPGSTGRLGTNSTANTSSPVQIGSNTNWATLGGSSYNALALTTSGDLYAWGQGYGGANGQNDSVSRSSPVQISGTWSSITNTSFVSTMIAIKPSGKLYIWGRNDKGQLGLGDVSINRSSPVQLGALSIWSQAAGGFQSLAVTTSGTLFSWGYNNTGQLGQGNTTNTSSPVQVGAGTNFRFVAVGGNSNSFVFTST